MNAAEASSYKVRQVVAQLKKMELIKEVKLGKKPLYSFDLEVIRNLTI